MHLATESLPSDGMATVGGVAHARPVIHARVLRAILDAAPLTTPARTRLLDEEGLVAGDLRGADASVPLASYMRIFDQLAEQLQRPTLGLDLSLRMGPELVGAVGYAFLHSATLDAAIDAFANAVFSIQGVTALQYARDPEPTVRYVISDDRLHPRRQDVEFSLGYVNALIRRFLARPYAPREVHVEHAPNGPRAQYDAIFGCPTYFEQPQNALILREVDIDEAGRLHDPHLVAILQHYMELARPGGLQRETTAQEVDALLPGLIETGNVSFRLVATRLGISEDRLRRRLHREGTSFRQLLRGRRCASAARHLTETDLSILQIAQGVGYGETASFTRAFLADTGMTPSDFRKLHRG